MSGVTNDCKLLSINRVSYQLLSALFAYLQTLDYILRQYKNSQFFTLLFIFEYVATSCPNKNELFTPFIDRKLSNNIKSKSA